MRCTITYRGVPLVAVDLESGERTFDLAPAALLPGYRLVLAPLFRRAEAGEQLRESHAAVGERQLCPICVSATVHAFEAEMAQEAHERLPEGKTLDSILARAEEHGTPDQRRQLALMLRVRAAREPGRLTPKAMAFLTRFAPPDAGS